MEDPLHHVVHVFHGPVYAPRRMVPPWWSDEDGKPIPTYPCPRCGREVASRFRGFQVEHLSHVGWGLFRASSYVNCCGHEQEIIPVPMRDGRVGFIPVLGEAR